MQTTLPNLAHNAPFILVAPDGVGGHWNDGRSVLVGNREPSHADDVGFILAIIDQLKAQELIDPYRVYITGASNGGEMTMRLACEKPERFAAASVVIATMPQGLTEHCPGRPVPIQFILGTKDPMMPWNGGNEARDQKTDLMLSGTDTVTWWAQHNRCDLSAVSGNIPDADSEDGSTVTKIEYSHCENPVIFYKINGGGHTWPRAEKSGNRVIRLLVKHIFGQTNHDIDSGEVIWDFFKIRPLSGVNRLN